MVLLEAMWSNVPIVTTAVGGIPELVGDSGAVLCPSENHTALASAITQLANDTHAATAQAKQAHERVSEHFDPATWITTYEQIYRSVVKN